MYEAWEAMTKYILYTRPLPRFS